jgi:hypothetical protein
VSFFSTSLCQCAELAQIYTQSAGIAGCFVNDRLLVRTFGQSGAHHLDALPAGLALLVIDNGAVFFFTLPFGNKGAGAARDHDRYTILLQLFLDDFLAKRSIDRINNPDRIHADSTAKIFETDCGCGS